jgi:hopene-associated glycosyltransferase HpnB
MLIAAGTLSLAIWIYLLLGRAGFWRIHHTIAPSPASEIPARVAVIIPARNEADVVGRTITSLLQQSGPHSIQIFLVDDSSTDGTAEAARKAAESTGIAARLTIIAGHPLPPGWSGKLWAVQQGIEQASKTSLDFLLLTDADIEHAPDSLLTLITIAQTGRYELVSFMVKLYCASLAEKLLIPAFVYFFFKLYPPALIANPHRATAGAAGGCILIRPAALAQAGGIEAIRHEVIDDCALARRVKESGARIWLGSSATTRSTRPYGTFADIGRMISRSAFNQLQHSSLLLLLSILGMALTYMLPPVLVLFSRHILPITLGALAWLVMIVTYIPVLRLYRLNPLWALALPLVAAFYMGATLHSAEKYWIGRGGEWKGRVQDSVRSSN